MHRMRLLATICLGGCVVWAAGCRSEVGGSGAGGADLSVGGQGGGKGDGPGGGGSGGSAGVSGGGGKGGSGGSGGAPKDMAMPRDLATGPLACKRGLAYNNENVSDLSAFKQGIGWWYDWGATPPTQPANTLIAGGVEYVPMIWTGPPHSNIDVAALTKSIPSSAKYLLGFNEPNFGNQANLTPEQAAAAWPQLEQLAKARNLALVSPAVNYCGGNCNDTDPFDWLDKFFAACSGCKIDYVAFHWYACTKEALQSMLPKFEAYGHPVWLTEFSCLDSADTSLAAQEAYMQAAIPVLEADPKVFRYSWFIGRSGNSWDILGNPGSLSALGNEYVGFSNRCTP